MPYVILKETSVMNQKLTVLVNDSEGITIEFDTSNKTARVVTIREF
jgi:hypothetical protein